jgi:monoamine oxidase
MRCMLPPRYRFATRSRSRHCVGFFGHVAEAPQAILWRFWGSDPYALGYVSHWAPGDLMAVGPLHGTHEPAFFVAGSDHWVAGYMEGAVRTGRAAARAVSSGEPL